MGRPCNCCGTVRCTECQCLDIERISLFQDNNTEPLGGWDTSYDYGIVFWWTDTRPKEYEYEVTMFNNPIGSFTVPAGSDPNGFIFVSNDALLPNLRRMASCEYFNYESPAFSEYGLDSFDKLAIRTAVNEDNKSSLLASDMQPDCDELYELSDLCDTVSTTYCTEYTAKNGFLVERIQASDDGYTTDLQAIVFTSFFSGCDDIVSKSAMSEDCLCIPPGQQEENCDTFFGSESPYTEANPSNYICPRMITDFTFTDSDLDKYQQADDVFCSFCQGFCGACGYYQPFASGDVVTLTDWTVPEDETEVWYEMSRGSNYLIERETGEAKQISNRERPTDPNPYAFRDPAGAPHYIINGTEEVWMLYSLVRIGDNIPLRNITWRRTTRTTSYTLTGSYDFAFQTPPEYISDQVGVPWNEKYWYGIPPRTPAEDIEGYLVNEGCDLYTGILEFNRSVDDVYVDVTYRPSHPFAVGSTFSWLGTGDTRGYYIMYYPDSPTFTGPNIAYNEYEFHIRLNAQYYPSKTYGLNFIEYELEYDAGSDCNIYTEIAPKCIWDGDTQTFFFENICPVAGNYITYSLTFEEDAVGIKLGLGNHTANLNIERA